MRESCWKRLVGASHPEVWFLDLDALDEPGRTPVRRLPISIRILIESALRRLGEPGFGEEAVRRLAAWVPGGGEGEIPFLPARVLLQDFTGVPCLADLAALRSAIRRMGGDPLRIELRIPADLVIDHSVQLDETGTDGALAVNMRREFERNIERYEFLRWGGNAFRNLRVLPPGLGICHQVNLEFLAACVRTERDERGRLLAYPDTLVGTDSHTTTINCLGVLGWGVGGIEAEAAMLGHPIPMRLPPVTGVRLLGRLPDSSNATDLALAVTERLRERGVVGHFVEFFGPGADSLPLADRVPVSNMAPEYGATMGFFPLDAEAIRYLRATGRPEEQAALAESVARAQGFWRNPGYEPLGVEVEEIDLSAIRPAVSGPRRPHERRDPGETARHFRRALCATDENEGFRIPESEAERLVRAGDLGEIGHGSVVLASITSCTNTSSPALLLEAALLARNAARRGLRPAAAVRTSFAPGSRAAAALLKRSGYLADLERMGFHAAAFGCATCIGNSGPLDPRVERAIREGGLIAAAVLSGNRNFEGRIHPAIRANYLCSPLLVVAYALAGDIRRDLETEPLGTDSSGRPVFLEELRPTAGELARAVKEAAGPADIADIYRRMGDIHPGWNRLAGSGGVVFEWDPDSTYIREPPFLQEIAPDPGPPADIRDAAILARLGDAVTTDHISPAGPIPAGSPAAGYLRSLGVAPEDYHSYGARRGNHEIMRRGVFAHPALHRLGRNPGGGPESLFETAERHLRNGVPLVVLAGRMYGAGSSRDWAAKGVRLLGVRAVIAESFERIHRSNLVGMGVLPVEFPEGTTVSSFEWRGSESLSIRGLDRVRPGGPVSVEIRRPDGGKTAFEGRLRIDTPMEMDIFRHGGILPRVLRHALAGTPPGQPSAQQV